VIEFRKCFPSAREVIRPYKETLVVGKERRKEPRKAFSEIVYCIVDKCIYKALLKNISVGGGLVKTRGSFRSGQEILISFHVPSLRKHLRISGEIAWVGTNEIGVRSIYSTPEVWDSYLSGLDTVQEGLFRFDEGYRRVGRFRKKKIIWRPSTSSGVSGYRLYWATRGEVSYNSDHADLGNLTEVTLPDDVPSFPLIEGNIELGVTAINEAGNESDITTLTEYFNFTVPDAPQNVELIDLE